jgi:protein farnesyltransferase/geranylgeranyltransferase type-1 subunit alpha
LFDDELIYVDRLIAEDIRNNSAWNQRYFVLKHTGFTPDVLQRELHYVMNRIRVVKNNESSWNFLRGLLQQGDGTLTQFPVVTDFAEDLFKSGIRSPYLLAFLVDLYIETYMESVVDEDGAATENGDGDQEQLSEKVFQLCNDLATQFDTIRAKYWNYVANTFRDETKERTFADAVNNKSDNVEPEAVQC